MQLKNDFEDYLESVFMEENPHLLDDDLPDAFGDYEWDIGELIEHGNKFGAELVEKIIAEYPTEQMPIYGLAELKQQLQAKYLK